MRIFLMALFSGILVMMLGMTIYASWDRSVFQVGAELTSDRWFQATLVDAYLGFLTFYVWVAFREPGLGRKLVWLVLIMTLGNMAMAAYVLIQLARWNPATGASGLLLPADFSRVSSSRSA